MDIYNDYQNYVKDHSKLIDYIKSNELKTYLIFEDCFKVLNYLSNKHIDGATLDPDEDEIFDLGFGYISNLIESLESYVKGPLHDDPIMIKKYDDILFYYCIFDDIRAFLEADGAIDEDIEERLQADEEYIDYILMNLKAVSQKDLDHLSDECQGIVPIDLDYQPTYAVFGLIADEMNIFE